MPLPDRQRSRAVLIGTGRYADDKLLDLPVVRRTIRDLAAALTDPVYGIVAENHCTVLEDQADIRLIGRDLRSAASQAQDLLLVYFVGHGLVDGRRHELYLGLPDSEWAEPGFNSLEYDKLRSAVLDSAAATKIIILDCCFSGRVVSEAMADPVTEVAGQIEVAGTYVLASAGRNQVALIQPGEDYTAFTGRFLHMLRNGVPDGPELLTIDYLYRQLVMRMRAEGLSQPQKRGTSTADQLALAGNRAFAAASQHLQQATDTAAPRAISAAPYGIETIKILQACLGVPDFTVDELAQQTGVSRRTVDTVIRRYQHAFDRLPSGKPGGRGRPAARWRLRSDHLDEVMAAVDSHQKALPASPPS